MSSEYGVDVSEPAKQDLLDIGRYISAQLNAPIASAQTVDLLDEGMHSLESNPKRHALVRDERLAAMGYRTLPVKNYLIFYKVNERARSVDIVRILYGRRDWASLL